ncbi:uncharacterized protein THITE_117101 [Thermothielavioides terrestris NRRL 8126]|uniref:Uncharacterized protein n=1 Tax=Thermothielavioides terrestris (strain ATCC 38088 / NRRL 8126) TaxID=578455 RepID=G2RGH9_THETT|nr:uncharacterized protein THITE_117101 [Thermothielavioides terrestris NRRL 8126]AEO71868.1 hypothetical protein THITE_117101 [Thermothielavioides terrestris NRRL 8126]
MGVYVAAHFRIVSAILAWWRATIYLVEEGFGFTFSFMRDLPIFKTSMEKRKPLVIPDFGQPGVQRAISDVVTPGLKASVRAIYRIITGSNVGYAPGVGNWSEFYSFHLNLCTQIWGGQNGPDQVL